MVDAKKFLKVLFLAFSCLFFIGLLLTSLFSNSFCSWCTCTCSWSSLHHPSCFWSLEFSLSLIIVPTHECRQIDLASMLLKLNLFGLVPLNSPWSLISLFSLSCIRLPAILFFDVSRFVQLPQKRSRGNQIIYRCLSKTKSVGLLMGSRSGIWVLPLVAHLHVPVPCTGLIWDGPFLARPNGPSSRGLYGP